MLRKLGTAFFICLVLLMPLGALGAGHHPATPTPTRAAHATATTTRTATATPLTPTASATATALATATATRAASATATLALPTPTATPGAPASGWHAPTTHEHGDAPPAWVNSWIAANASLYGSATLIYGGDERSSDIENTMKHESFKGALMVSSAGTQIYLRYHASGNPHDRSARYHSYEVFYLDTQGGISFMQGWYDSGSGEPYPTGGRVPLRDTPEPGVRPVILVVDAESNRLNIPCEQWYMDGQGPFQPTFGVNICAPPVLYASGENAYAMDPSQWPINPLNNWGLNRQEEAFYYPQQPGVRWATPLGVPCSQGTAGCLYNVVAPTLNADARELYGIFRIGGSVTKEYPCPACSTPKN